MQEPITERIERRRCQLCDGCLNHRALRTIGAANPTVPVATEDHEPRASRLCHLSNLQSGLNEMGPTNPGRRPAVAINGVDLRTVPRARAANTRGVARASDADTSRTRDDARRDTLDTGVPPAGPRHDSRADTDRTSAR